MRLNSTPRQDGFYMPSELAEHKCTYLLWPERPDNWRGGAKPAQKAFREVVEKIAKHEPVVLGVNQSQYSHVLGMNMKNVRIVEISNNDSWVRDTGATMVVNGNGEIRAVDWGFNGYGGLVDGIYFPWDLDDMIAAKMAAIEGVDRCMCIFDESKQKLKGFYMGTIEKNQLHTIMRETMPAFMVPGYIRKVEEMILTKNGKLDRKKTAELVGGSKNG